jgi:hypothetical protein
MHFNSGAGGTSRQAIKGGFTEVVLATPCAPDEWPHVGDWDDSARLPQR